MSASSSTKRALLIGCNYINTPSTRLYGCIEDIINIRTVLTTKYDYSPQNVVVLRDDIPENMPTKTRILNELRKIVAASASSSEIWIHYSGHGTQITDFNRDERDSRDEAIVPCDYNIGGLISDDVIFDTIKTTKCRTLMFFDSCHSGSVCDLQYEINYVNGSFVKSQYTNKTITNPKVIMMSGCRDEQTSADTYDTVLKKSVGAFTMSFIRVLEKMNYVGDVMAVYAAVCAELIRAKHTQIPVLSSSEATPSFIFGKPEILPVPAPAPIPQPDVIPMPAPAPKPPTPTTTSTPKPPALVLLPYKKPVKTSIMPMKLTNNGPRPTYTTKIRRVKDKFISSVRRRMRYIIWQN